MWSSVNSVANSQSPELRAVGLKRKNDWINKFLNFDGWVDFTGFCHLRGDKIVARCHHDHQRRHGRGDTRCAWGDCRLAGGRYLRGWTPQGKVACDMWSRVAFNDMVVEGNRNIATMRTRAKRVIDGGVRVSSGG